ncbi:hypothetical protein Lser_V15G30114 [Lactuca serriola]
MAFVTSGDAYSDPSHYRSLVGAFQYLPITRPHISFAVNQVSQFLQAPTISHYEAVTRLLRYVKGTISLGLCFSKLAYTTLVCYSDADWACYLDTCCSTYGYSIFLGREKERNREKKEILLVENGVLSRSRLNDACHNEKKREGEAVFPPLPRRQANAMYVF